MIKIYYGDDRVRIEREVRRELGAEYEVIEGRNIKCADLPSIFLGASLFAEKRRILLKDLQENKEVWERLPEYVATEHDVVIWEASLDKRKAAYKVLVAAGVPMGECKMAEPVEKKLVFDIYDTALVDGPRAVGMVEKIENTQDPYMFVGLMVTQAMKKYEWRYGAKEKRALKELSRLDMQMKLTSSLQPWTLVKSFLLRVSQL